MVSSVLSPEKIVGRQNKNRAAAQNFISGGSILGSSVVNSAANKIVGFQRAGIRPSTPAIESIVSTISTNINNNVTSVINKTLQGFSADYQRRVQQVDDAKPIGVLGKFLNVYKTALGFIQFFGNKRNIDKVRDNLEALKKSFTESFEVAKLIRQVIIKIVKQLSSLPVASPSGGGGLNLDIDLPGGLLKRNDPKGLGRMLGGGKMLALGAGALGLGALGAGAVNALADSPQEQAQAAATSNIPGDDVDRFASIVDRFANVISELFKLGKDTGKKGNAASSPAASSPGGSPGGPGPSGPLNGVTIQDDAQALSELGITQEQFNAYKQGIADVEGAGYNEMGGAGVRFAGRYQMGSGEIASAAAVMGIPNPTQEEFLNNPQLQEKIYMGRTILMNRRMLQISPEYKNMSQTERLPVLAGAQLGEGSLADYLKGKSVSDSAGVEIERWINAARLRLSQSRAGAFSSQTPTAPTAPILPPPGQGGPDLPSWVIPSPTSAQNVQQIATTSGIAQPPPSQQMQQPVVLPIDLSGGTQQQTGGGGVTPAIPSQKNGPSVPFLHAANTDNFLVLYSKMVYNIVDG